MKIVHYVVAQVANDNKIFDEKLLTDTCQSVLTHVTA
jgi:hypothetical protein